MAVFTVRTTATTCVLFACSLVQKTLNSVQLSKFANSMCNLVDFIGLYRDGHETIKLETKTRPRHSPP